MLYQLEPRGNQPGRQAAASGKPHGETTRAAGSAFGHQPNHRSRQLQPSSNFVSRTAFTQRGRTGMQDSLRCPSILQQHPCLPSRGHQRSASPQAMRAAATSPVAPSTASLPAPRPKASLGASRRGTRSLSPVPRAATGTVAPEPRADLLFVFGVVFITARILVLLPVFAMLAGGQEDNILPVMDVI